MVPCVAWLFFWMFCPELSSITVCWDVFEDVSNCFCSWTCRGAPEFLWKMLETTFLQRTGGDHIAPVNLERPDFHPSRLAQAMLRRAHRHRSDAARSSWRPWEVSTASTGSWAEAWPRPCECWMRTAFGHWDHWNDEICWEWVLQSATMFFFKKIVVLISTMYLYT